MLKLFCVLAIGVLGVGGGWIMGIIFDYLFGVSVQETSQADIDVTIKALEKRGASKDYLDEIRNLNGI